MGTVINWPYEWLPKDSENWRECNGQSIADTALCKETGQCAAPDYRGMFLRGSGGNSGKLGETQEGAVHIPSDAGVKVALSGLKLGQAIIGGSGGGAEDGNYGDHVARFGDAINNGQYKNFLGWGYGGGYVNENSGAHSLQFGLSIISPAKETRPTNKAVRYLIKVN